MSIERYSIINDKNPREIVLLKARRCQWGICSFCDYIHDNSNDDEEIIGVNKNVLKNVTGVHQKLEVINSGSCFELPEETLKDIREIIQKNNIQNLYLESHYMYKDRLNEMRNFFNIPITFKCGIETFDDYFRNKILKKGIHFNSPNDISNFFDSICLMVGIKGQTRQMIHRDMDILQTYFKRGCINIYVNNSTEIIADPELINWFREEYSFLESNPMIEILWNNTDFGVGGKEQ